MYFAVGSKRSRQRYHINNGSKTEVQKLIFTCKVSICVQFYNMGCDLQTVIKEMCDTKEWSYVPSVKEHITPDLGRFMF